MCISVCMHLCVYVYVFAYKIYVRAFNVCVFAQVHGGKTADGQDVAVEIIYPNLRKDRVCFFIQNLCSCI